MAAGVRAPAITARALLARRPAWMNALWLLCAYMACLRVPFDLLVTPVADDQEVWFGLLLTGWPAKLSAPLHLVIYGLGAWGFWHMRTWMWPWASVYAAQVAIGMLVWNLTDPRGAGAVGGVPLFLAGACLAIALWRARCAFGRN